jgi:hypothetical protein
MHCERSKVIGEIINLGTERSLSLTEWMREIPIITKAGTRELH